MAEELLGWSDGWLTMGAFMRDVYIPLSPFLFAGVSGLSWATARW